MNTYLSIALGLTVAGVAACGAAAGVPETNTSDIKTSQQPLEALIPLRGCGEVESYLRERLAADVNGYVDQMIAQVDTGPGCGSYWMNSSAHGSPQMASVPTAGAPMNQSGGMNNGMNAANSSAGPRASQTSTTNNQVAGVDEADFVKNDDKYLYVVANGALRILQAWPANEARELAKVTLEGEPRKLFVEGDRALVYVAVPSTGTEGSGAYPPWFRGQGECTYGYDCVPTGDGTRTKVLVFDITNRASPVKVRELELSGSLLSARRIGNAVHTVVVDTPKTTIDGLQYALDPSAYDCDDPDDTVRWDPRVVGDPRYMQGLAQKRRLKEAWEALRQKNLAAIANADVLASLPSAKEGGADAVPACNGYYRPSLAEGRTFTTLYSMDMVGDEKPTSATVVSDPGVVYASETGLYMSVPRSKAVARDWYPSMGSEAHASLVHAFRIGNRPSLTAYEASGIVKGRVLNQFALDEYDGRLRVATTSGHTPDPKVHSTMSVLERRGKSLVLTGKVDDIAPSEDIRSVRFDGPRAFVVTFKKTDPLYVFDLEKSSAPRIAGELKIPGFSTYMHMMDPEHLLTIGYDAEDQGNFAWFSGVMLQIFDVADMNNPKLAHKEVIGTRGSSSEALTNHLAFTYYAPKNLLALPMTICEGGSGGSYGTNMTFSGLLVYDVTANGGFSKRGQVAHPNASKGYDSRGCSSWWTQAHSEVKRSVIMDDFVYSISERRVKVNGLSNLASDIAEISLEQ